MTVLVAAASKHGATAEIAERIGAALRAHGVGVDVRALDDADELGAYEAFVLGSGVYLGNWLEEARRFLDAHAAELADRPTWLFASISARGAVGNGRGPCGSRTRKAQLLRERLRCVPLTGDQARRR